MRYLTLSLVVLAVFTASIGLAQDDKAKDAKQDGKAEEMKMESVTLEGLLVDMKCFSMNSANTGNDHMTPKGKMPACAVACSKMGIPVGILVEGEGDDDATLVVLITPGAQLSDHMAKQAKITGSPALNGHGIIPDKIMVKTGAKWEEVKIATMM